MAREPHQRPLQFDLKAVFRVTTVVALLSAVCHYLSLDVLVAIAVVCCLLACTGFVLCVACMALGIVCGEFFAWLWPRPPEPHS
jgi:hypothetical protein